LTLTANQCLCVSFAVGTPFLFFFFFFLFVFSFFFFYFRSRVCCSLSGFPWPPLCHWLAPGSAWPSCYLTWGLLCMCIFIRIFPSSSVFFCCFSSILYGFFSNDVLPPDAALGRSRLFCPHFYPPMVLSISCFLICLFTFLLDVCFEMY